MKKLCSIFLSTTFILAAATSCCLYRMPSSEDDLYSIPITNNPHVLDKPADSLVPGITT